MEKLIIIAPIAGLVALLFAVLTAVSINKKPSGNDRMKEIADAISSGARAFLFSEYKILVFFVGALFLLIGFCFPTAGLLQPASLQGHYFQHLQATSECQLQQKRMYEQPMPHWAAICPRL